MPIATNKGGDFSPAPAGVHHAVCVQVIDIGTQPQQGNFPSRRKVMITWELPHELIDVKDEAGPMPRWVSRDYTLSTGKSANMRKDLESWRGRPFTQEEVARFDVGNLIGANCQLSIVHKKSADGSKTYANVAAIMPLPKGAMKLKPVSRTMVFDLPESLPVEFPKEMPEWLQNKIKNSDEYDQLVNPSHRPDPTESQMANQDSAGFEEDVPF